MHTDTMQHAPPFFVEQGVNCNIHRVDLSTEILDLLTDRVNLSNRHTRPVLVLLAGQGGHHR